MNVGRNCTQEIYGEHYRNESMALVVGLAEITRLLDVTSTSSKNIEDWENPGTFL